MKYLKYLCLVIYIFITMVIFIKAFESAESSSESSDQVTDVIVGTIDGITPGDESITDKFSLEDIKLFIRKAFGHFGVFLLLGVFATVTYYFFIKRKLYGIIITILAGIITSGLSELFQTIPEGRGPSFGDVLLNYLGYAISMLVIGLILYIPWYKKAKEVGSI